MSNKVKFLIDTPSYTDASGGCIALHKLAEMLADRGYETYTTSPTKAGSKAIYIGNNPGSKLDFNITMVVYPEVVIGNPYDAKYVTRWILNTPGKIGGDGVFGKNDLIYKYSDLFDVINNNKVHGYLTCIDTKKDYFVDLKLNREGSSYLIKKGKLENKALIHHPKDSLNIDDFKSDAYLLDVFNQKEIFISYDAASYHSVQAALCGCISVVIPDANITKDEWYKKHDIVKHGIAYGMDDIQWAKDTMHLLRSDLQILEDKCEKTVDEYIEKCISTIRPMSLPKVTNRLIKRIVASFKYRTGKFLNKLNLIHSKVS